MKQPKLFKKTMGGWLLLVMLMFTSLASYGQTAYAVVSTDRTTLTFYYDDLMSTRPGTAYRLKFSFEEPGWYVSRSGITTVVFDSSFADVRPSGTYYWFDGMKNLTSITGIEYLNTSMTKNFNHMFYGCSSLTTLDLSTFDTQNVTEMIAMFYNCQNLVTIYVGDGWVTSGNINGHNMFFNCNSLVGGQGTVYDPMCYEFDYAHVDGGPDNPGYLTYKSNCMRGDVDGNGAVDIDDATMLINYLLYDDAEGINLENANCDLEEGIDIDDATALINFLLYDTW